MPNLYISNEAQSFAMISSPPQRPLCVVGRLGREKERARWARWEGEREQKAPAFSLFPSFPARFLFFSIIAIVIGIPSGSLCGGESVGFIMEKKILPL